MNARRIRSHVFVGWLACAGLAVSACATAMPPKELVEARNAYRQAESGPAARLKPAELHDAKVALDRAEAEFQSSPSDPKVSDLGYVAKRKAEFADSQANAAAAMEEKTAVENETAKVQSEVLDKAAQRMKGLEGEVAQSKEEIARQKDQAAKEIARQKDETAKEKAGRVEAERKARDAMDALTKFMAVKNEERGMVITIPGSVLFATGQSTLLPGAQAKLDKVADALSTQTERHFTVEGHTDNQGTDAVNQVLSQKRADAVRDYLIVHGVAAASISAVGKGASTPVADNKTIEGRAMNRRVEIVVERQQ